jgi:hypothetical protein
MNSTDHWGKIHKKLFEHLASVPSSRHACTGSNDVNWSGINEA